MPMLTAEEKAAARKARSFTSDGWGTKRGGL